MGVAKLGAQLNDRYVDIVINHESMKTNKDMASHTSHTDRQLVYRRVKQVVPHCNVCGEQLRGNGSDVLPYRCGCGVWEYRWNVGSFTHRYDIKK